MKRFVVTCDKNAQSYCSTAIIVSEYNAAAEKLGLYDENGLVVHYDCLCQDFGQHVDAFICPYELPLPYPILNNAKGRNLIGLSKDNAFMFQKAGYPIDKINYVSLGVNREIWKPVEKTENLDKFVFLTCIESTVRACLIELLDAFGTLFSGNKDVVLYIKDRLPTEQFKKVVRDFAKDRNIEVIHDCRHVEDFEETRKLFAGADCHVYLNRAGTWCMTILEAVSCGLSTIALNYSGPHDFLSHNLNCLSVEYDLISVQQDHLNYLESLGMKNFLFPPASYPNPPFWAQPRQMSIITCLKNMYENEKMRKDFREAGFMTANWFTWERAAINLSHVLEGFKYD